MGLTVVNADNSTLEASSDGATWIDVPFIGDVSASPGTTPETDIITFTEIGKIRGKTRVPTLNVTVPAYVPNLPIWKTIIDAAQGSQYLNWRLTTLERPIFEADSGTPMAAVSAAGVLTLSGVGAPDLETEDYGIGLAVVVGGKAYTLVDITGSKTAVVAPVPGAAVAADDAFSIVVPSLRKQFVGQPGSPDDNFSLPAEGAMSTTFDVSLRAALPRWSIVV